MIELIQQNFTRGRIQYALFDFDGTLSLIREGWVNVMVPYLVEEIMKTPRHEEEEAIYQTVREFVTRLTGKQTIYQMIQLSEEITKRGGTPQDPLVYKHEYLARLWKRICHRVEDLHSGKIDPDEMLVPGSRELLENLRRRGIRCILASGTDEPYVLDEANALKISDYFIGIYGALDQYKNFSKKMLIDRIFNEHKLNGPEFVAFGDGYVEIEDTVRVGGISVGVASNEAERKGVDEWKRNRLIQAGAHLIIPDFREQDRVLAYLMQETDSLN